LPENKYYIFGKGGGENLAEEFSVPFLGEIPLVQGIREGGDEGRPVVLNEDITSGAFCDLAENIAQQVAIVNATGEKSKIVEVNR
jgi:ATP-binding protein involved in chromosome partitioning